MESQLQHTHGHHYDLSAGNPSALHSGVEGPSEVHHEKPSMLKKVKEKAKKIKNTLTKHGHEHDHDHGEYEEDKDEDEDEEMVEEPEIHGAPIYESEAVRAATRASNEQPSAGETNLDRPSTVDPHYDSRIVDPETRPCPDQSNAIKGIHGGIGTTGFEVDPQGPNIRAHPSHVQIKTIDPAGIGSEEAEGITPVIKSFNKMGISEEKPKTEQGEGLYRGSHDQFAPEPMPRQSSESVPKSYNAANPRDMYGDIYDPASQSSTYTEKITSASAAAASAIASTAQSAKNVIASKIGQMREPGEGNKSGSVTGTASDYAHRTSKVSSGLGAEPTQESGGNVGRDRGVSAKKYWVEKLKPGDEDKALSAMITESLSKPKGQKTEEVPSEGGGGGGRSVSQIVSDAIHKREPEQSEEQKPMGKVTESKEVAKHLGTGEEGSGLENVGTGAGVVNKLTGAIGSWFGGQGGQAQSTPGTTLADNNEGDMRKDANAQGVTGERRLQESSN